VKISEEFSPVRLMLVGSATSLARELQGAGYSPSMIADTAAAWDEIRGGGPCLVVLRAEHKDCEALRLVNRLRAQADTLGVRVLLVSGDASNESLARAALDCGADECVFLPFATSELLARVGKLFRQCASAAATANARPLQAAAATPGSEWELLQSLGQGVLGIDPHGRITFENPEARALLGWRPGELVAWDVHAALHGRHEGPRACSPEARPINGTLRDGKPRRVYDANFLRRDGTGFPVEYVCTPVRDAGGALAGAVLCFSDMTQTRRAAERTHERLAESLALTKIATWLARLGAWTIDLPERKLTWSDENCAIHEVPPGYQPTLEEGISLFPPEHREHVTRLVDACARDGTPYEFEVPKFTAKGRSIWVRSMGEAVRDSTGRIVRLQGAFQDITERKLAEEALAQKDALLRIAGRVARIGGWAIDMSQHRIDWSGEVIDILELGREHPPLREFLRLASAQGRRRLAAAIGHCARTGTPFDLEAQVATSRGRPIWVRVIGEAERDASGAVRRVQGAVQDISERLTLEEQLRQAQRLESLGQLTGGVAHDFNNLLTVILGNAGILGEELEGVAHLQPLAQVVVDAAQRGADLTQRLLAFARRQALEPKVVDINQLVSGMDTILRRALGDHIVIDIQGADELWPALVDPMQLDNTLLNLCLNARDAMPRGGCLSIRTANEQLDHMRESRRRDVKAGQYVMLAVTDTGTGIAPEHMPRVFEPFFTTKEKGKGTGLGLAMTYGFVKQSAGHVEIESEPGRGTTVRLYLPRAAEAASERPQAALPVDHRPVRPRTGQTIMLVEDDELVRRFVHQQLLAMGYTVLEAHNGMQALAILDRGECVDLLFTDVVMPGMSGRELVELARAKRPALRVLYTSGYAEDAIVHDGRLDAGVQLLAKPYRRDEFARRISAALAE
jgi:PAS domain S-box-containing protein